MKIQSKIHLYNILTIVFTILTVVSLGSIADMSFHTVVVNVVLFAMLTRMCYNKENQLRRILKNRRKARKVQLSVYKGRHASAVHAA